MIVKFEAAPSIFMTALLMHPRHACWERPRTLRMRKARRPGVQSKTPAPRRAAGSPLYARVRAQPSHPTFLTKCMTAEEHDALAAEFVAQSKSSLTVL